MLLHVWNNVLNTIFFSHRRKHLRSSFMLLHSYYFHPSTSLVPKSFADTSSPLKRLSCLKTNPLRVFSGRAGPALARGRRKPMAGDRSKDRAQGTRLGAGSSNVLLETLFTLGEHIAITDPSMSLCLSSVLVCACCIACASLVRAASLSKWICGQEWRSPYGKLMHVN